MSVGETRAGQVTGLVSLLAVAIALGAPGCSLLFSESLLGVADSGTADERDADVEPGEDGGDGADARNSGTGGSVNCGAMGELAANLLDPSVLSLHWGLGGRTTEFVQGNMHVDTTGWIASDAVALRGRREYPVPYALDMHVSQIPDEANAQFLLKFEHNNDDADFIEVAVTSSEVRIFSSYTGASDIHDRLPSLPGQSDYYVRMLQDSGTLEIHESPNGTQWSRVQSLAFADTDARPRIAARVSDDVIDPHPPMILHSLGGSCAR